jgi:hypothetical protein
MGTLDPLHDFTFTPYDVIQSESTNVILNSEDSHLEIMDISAIEKE